MIGRDSDEGLNFPCVLCIGPIVIGRKMPE